MYSRLHEAIRGIALANSPKHFIVGSTRVGLQKPALGKKNKKIVRSDDRPHYTLLRPDEIITRLGVKKIVVDGERRGQVPYRRAHPRFLSHERFTAMRNQWIIVRVDCYPPPDICGPLTLTAAEFPISDHIGSVRS